VTLYFHGNLCNLNPGQGEGNGPGSGIRGGSLMGGCCGTTRNHIRARGEAQMGLSGPRCFVDRLPHSRCAATTLENSTPPETPWRGEEGIPFSAFPCVIWGIPIRS